MFSRLKESFRNIAQMKYYLVYQSNQYIQIELSHTTFSYYLNRLSEIYCNFIYCMTDLILTHRVRDIQLKRA